MSEDKFIDVKRLLESKNPKLAKRLPQGIVQYLKYTLHEKEVNHFLEYNRDKKNTDWCQAAVDYMDITLSVKGIEKIPKKGKITIALNHPLGGMDAMILVSALRGHREDLKFIVNDILLNIENMRGMFVGINKHGKNKGSIRNQVKELFESEDAVCIFPAGMVSRKENGIIRDLEWKKTFVTYAKECDRTIIPIYIDGELSRFFYGLYRFRKAIGVKSNIEMLYLVSELFKQRKKHMQFVVGDPIDRDYLMNNPNDNELAQEIKEKVYELRKQL